MRGANQGPRRTTWFTELPTGGAAQHAPRSGAPAGSRDMRDPAGTHRGVSSSELHAPADHEGRLALAAGGPHGGAGEAVGETVGHLGVVHARVEIVVFVEHVVDHERR